MTVDAFIAVPLLRVHPDRARRNESVEDAEEGICPPRHVRLISAPVTVATAGLLEIWIDQAEQRAWFLFEVTR